MSRAVMVWLRCVLAAGLCTASAMARAAPAADLILYNAAVWTADETRPGAEAVAVRGNKIVKVGTNREVLALRGGATRVLDLKDRMVVPGFIDGHTHFENATEWFFEALLMDVDTEDEMVARLQTAAARVPERHWITGGDEAHLTPELGDLRGVARIAEQYRRGIARHQAHQREHDHRHDEQRRDDRRDPP